MNQIATHVFQVLGPGYSEAVYHRAFEVMLRKMGYEYQTEVIVPIPFENHVIGNVRLDLVVQNDTLIELKSVAKLNDTMRTQIKKYLELTRYKIGYLINFPPTNKDLEIEVHKIEE